MPTSWEWEDEREKEGSPKLTRALPKLQSAEEINLTPRGASDRP